MSENGLRKLFRINKIKMFMSVSICVQYNISSMCCVDRKIITGKKSQYFFSTYTIPRKVTVCIIIFVLFLTFFFVFVLFVCVCFFVSYEWHFLINISGSLLKNYTTPILVRTFGVVSLTMHLFSGSLSFSLSGFF